MRFERTTGDYVNIPLVYVKTADQLTQCVDWCAAQASIAIDLETSGLFAHKDQVATLQVGNPLAAQPKAWVIDVRLFTVAQLRPLFDLLEDESLIKVGQNLRFEYRFLRHHYGVRLRNVIDTQLCEMVLRTGILAYAAAKLKTGKGAQIDEDKAGKGGYKLTSMEHLARHYLGLELDKDQRLRTGFYKTAPGEHTPRQLHYAAGDVLYPYWIFEQQRVLLKARKLNHVFKVECACLPVIAEMEHQGLGFDPTPWMKLYQQALTNRQAAERQLDQLLVGMQGDLFGGTNADVRPLYYGGGRKKPTPMNYGSPDHVKQAVVNYCKSVGWKVEVVTREERFNELLQYHGTLWLIERRERVRAQLEETPESHTKKREELEERLKDWQRKTWEDAPWHVIPEDKYVILVSVAKDQLILAKCRSQLPAALVDPLIAYSKADQLVSAFGSNWVQKIRPDTGRIHQEIHQCMTTTGRLSGTPNLMQIPRDSDYRKCFVPRKGWKFVCADYSQQEPRIMAFASQDPTYWQTYVDHDDLYCRVGENMLPARPTKGSVERDVMKVVVLSKAYRAGPAKLRDQLTVALAEKIMAGAVPVPTLDYAYQLDRDFFAAFDRIKEFQDECSAQADPATGPKVYDDLLDADVTFIRDPSGRIRFFPPDAANAYTEGPNMICQGGSATMTKLAAVFFTKALYDRGWQERAFIVNIIHDEILAEAEDEIAQEVAYLLQQAMLRAAEQYCPGLPFEAEFPENSTGVIPFWTKKLPKAA